MDATSFNLHTFFFLSFSSLHLLMEMNQMPLKMFNRNDPIKCFEACMNFKGICNQNIFVTTARIGNVSVFEHPCAINFICTRVQHTMTSNYTIA